MTLVNLLNEVICEYKNKNIQLKTALEIFEPADFVYKPWFSNGANFSKNLNLLKFLECILLETLYLKVDNPVHVHDFMSLVKQYYSTEDVLLELVEHLQKTNNLTNNPFDTVEKTNQDLMEFCTSYLATLKLKVKWWKPNKDVIDMPYILLTES